MPPLVNEQTLDAVNSVNAKLGMEMGSIGAAGLATQNQVSLQQRVNEVATDSLAGYLALSRNATANALAFSQAITARACRMAFDISAEEAVSFTKEIGADLSQRLAEFGAQLAALQEQAKVANTTPPQTGTGGAFGSAQFDPILSAIADLKAEVEALKAK